MSRICITHTPTPTKSLTPTITSSPTVTISPTQTRTPLATPQINNAHDLNFAVTTASRIVATGGGRLRLLIQDFENILQMADVRDDYYPDLDNDYVNIYLKFLDLCKYEGSAYISSHLLSKKDLLSITTEVPLSEVGSFASNWIEYMASQGVYKIALKMVEPSDDQHKSFLRGYSSIIPPILNNVRDAYGFYWPWSHDAFGYELSLIDPNRDKSSLELPANAERLDNFYIYIPLSGSENIDDAIFRGYFHMRRLLCYYYDDCDTWRIDNSGSVVNTGLTNDLEINEQDISDPKFVPWFVSTAATSPTSLTNINPSRSTLCQIKGGTLSNSWMQQYPPPVRYNYQDVTLYSRVTEESTHDSEEHPCAGKARIYASRTDTEKILSEILPLSEEGPNDILSRAYTLLGITPYRLSGYTSQRTFYKDILQVQYWTQKDPFILPYPIKARNATWPDHVYFNAYYGSQGGLTVRGPAKDMIESLVDSQELMTYEFSFLPISLEFEFLSMETLKRILLFNSEYNGIFEYRIESNDTLVNDFIGLLISNYIQENLPDIPSQLAVLPDVYDDTLERCKEGVPPKGYRSNLTVDEIFALPFKIMSVIAEQQPTFRLDEPNREEEEIEITNITSSKKCGKKRVVPSDSYYATYKSAGWFDIQDYYKPCYKLCGSEVVHAFDIAGFSDLVSKISKTIKSTGKKVLKSICIRNICCQDAEPKNREKCRYTNEVEVQDCVEKSSNSPYAILRLPEYIPPDSSVNIGNINPDRCSSLINTIKDEGRLILGYFWGAKISNASEILPKCNVEKWPCPSPTPTPSTTVNPIPSFTPTPIDSATPLPTRSPPPPTPTPTSSSSPTPSASATTTATPTNTSSSINYCYDIDGQGNSNTNNSSNTNNNNFTSAEFFEPYVYNIPSANGLGGYISNNVNVSLFLGSQYLPIDTIGWTAQSTPLHPAVTNDIITLIETMFNSGSLFPLGMERTSLPLYIRVEGSSYFVTIHRGRLLVTTVSCGTDEQIIDLSIEDNELPNTESVPVQPPVIIPVISPTNRPTQTPTPSTSVTITQTPTPTSTDLKPTHTPTNSATVTQSITTTQTPTTTTTPSITPSHTPTPSLSQTPEPTPSITPSVSPTTIYRVVTMRIFTDPSIFCTLP